MSSSDKIEVSGIVKEVLPGTKFKIDLEDTKLKTEVIAHLSGKMKKNNIKVIPGDYVTVEVSIYNLTEGRIIYRYSSEAAAKKAKMEAIMNNPKQTKK